MGRELDGCVGVGIGVNGCVGVGIGVYSWGRGVDWVLGYGVRVLGERREVFWDVDGCVGVGIGG